MERRKKMAVLAVSLYEVAIAMAGVFLLFPVLAGETNTALGLVPVLSFLVCFIAFWRLSGARSLLYSFSVVLPFLYHQVLLLAGVTEPTGFHFAPVGVAALVAAVIMESRGRPFSEILYLAGTVLAGLSVLTSGQGQLPWIAALWAACFLVVSRTGQGQITAHTAAEDGGPSGV
jgi:hypothetical protein